METKIYIHGVRGKLGRTLLNLIEKDSSLTYKDRLEAADVAIDFSVPEALQKLLLDCSEYKKPLVIGTTGFTSDDEKMIENTAQSIPILYASNFSLAMTICFQVAHDISKKLDCQIEIIEAHRKDKKDKPSGTALHLRKVMGNPDIPIHSIRAGDIPGEHTIIFALPGERIELKYQAQSREAFAHGALVAAKFLKHKNPGLYSLKDLYALNKS